MRRVMSPYFWVLLSLSQLTRWSSAFSPRTRTSPVSRHASSPISWSQHSQSSRAQVWLQVFDKLFEESGPLGKGITVGKVQVALACRDRGTGSIYGILEEGARSTKKESESLGELANRVSLALLRKSDDWVAATSTSKWFKSDDYGKAESLFNDWANKEAAKFEKEYVPSAGSEEKGGGATTVVVSMILEIQGDSTRFDGAGFSILGTQEVLSTIASDCMVEYGDCVNAVEVFWTPSERDEVLTSRDVVLDFPELIDL